MKKTYVMDIDGKPGCASRAENDANAAAIVESMYSGPLKRPDGVLTIRLGTIPERQEWQWASLLPSDDDPEHEDDPEWNPDGMIVSLDMVEAEKKGR